MKYFYLLTIIVISLVTVSCKKEKKTIIEGKVVESGNKQPIEGVQIHVQDGISSGGGWFSLGHSKTSGTGQDFYTFTDKNGYFSITVTGESPSLELDKANYFWQYTTSGAGQRFKFYNTGGTYKNEYFEMDADAFFNPILKGHNCIVSDSVLVLGGPYIPKGKGGGGYYTYEGNGPNKFAEGLKGLLAVGNKYYPYGILWQEHGVWQAGRIDSVFIKSFTTYTDTIYY